MRDQAVPSAFRRAGTWIVLGLALVFAPAVAPAAPEAADAASRAVPAVPDRFSGTVPSDLGDLTATEHGSLLPGSKRGSGNPWLSDPCAQPRRATFDGPGRCSRLAGPADSVLPGAAPRGVLHGLAPPDR